MKKLTILFMLLGVSLCGYNQVLPKPQYYLKVDTQKHFVYGRWIPFALQNKIDTISFFNLYYTNEWSPTAPPTPDKITHIYLSPKQMLSGDLICGLNISIAFGDWSSLHDVDSIPFSAFTDVVSNYSFIVPNNIPFISYRPDTSYIAIPATNPNVYFNPFLNMVMKISYSTASYNDNNCKNSYWELRSTKLSYWDGLTTIMQVNPYTNKANRPPTTEEVLYFGFDLANKPVSVAEIPDKGQLSIYPNPAKDKIYITDARYDRIYSICDITGKVLLQGKMKQDGIIDIRDLAQGLYIIKLDHQNLKFLKE